jgi:prepilin peptidase CpaA
MLEYLQFATLLAAAAMMVFAACYDLFTMTIPNRLSLALGGLFLACALLLGMDWIDVALHLSAGLLVLAVGIGLFAAGWVGGGDVKFAAATTLWMGFAHVLEYLFIASLAGGLLTILILALRRLPIPARAQGWVWLDRLHDPRSGIPYGVALAAGGLFVLPRSSVWAAAFGL